MHNKTRDIKCKGRTEGRWRRRGESRGEGMNVKGEEGMGKGEGKTQAG